MVKVELSLVEPSPKHAATPGTQVARYLLKHVGEELHAILTQEGPKDARVRLLPSCAGAFETEAPR